MVHPNAEINQVELSSAGQPPGQDEASDSKQRNQAPNPFTIAKDYAVGVALQEDRRRSRMLIRFNEKPGSDITAVLKGHGFRFDGQEKVWAKPFHPERGAFSVRMDAECFFEEIVAAIREQRGIEQSTGILMGR